MGGMSNLGAGLLGIASVGVLTLLGIALAAVGLGAVRKAHAPAGYCLAGAGALTIFTSAWRQLMNLALSFAGVNMTSLYTVSRVVTLGLQVVASVLLPVSIFLLASAVKRGAGQAQGPRFHS